MFLFHNLNLKSFKRVQQNLKVTFKVDWSRIW